MANQKPVDEIRIGRVKATVWRNGTEEQSRYNVTFSRLYKEGDQWKSTHSFGRNDLLVLAKVADFAHTRIFQLPVGSRTPGGSGGRVLAGNRPRARRSRVLRRASFFLSPTWTNPPGRFPVSFPLYLICPPTLAVYGLPLPACLLPMTATLSLLRQGPCCDGVYIRILSYIFLFT